jgi:capsular exopolysaccharide synthesis family protein
MRKSSGKVVMFTSTTSGEGKTFIACNLAVSTAMLGKKVLLMGLDIRRPRLAEMFKFNSKAEGFTSYLVADEDEVGMLDRLILHSDIVEGFDILPAGIVPPNPAELLSGGNLERAIAYLSTKYDSIILDTAPVGIVTDSLILSRVADAVVYVVRLGHTHKYDLDFLGGLVSDGKLENVSVAVLSAAYVVEHLSDMICLILSNPNFCSSLVSMNVFLSSKSYSPYSFDNEVLNNSFNSLIFCIGVTLPPLTKETLPVSSDTTTASASVLSVMPMAALCLMP